MALKAEGSVRYVHFAAYRMPHAAHGHRPGVISSLTLSGFQTKTAPVGMTQLPRRVTRRPRRKPRGGGQWAR